MVVRFVDLVPVTKEREVHSVQRDGKIARQLFSVEWITTWQTTYPVCRGDDVRWWWYVVSEQLPHFRDLMYDARFQGFLRTWFYVYMFIMCIRMYVHLYIYLAFLCVPCWQTIGDTELNEPALNPSLCAACLQGIETLFNLQVVQATNWRLAHFLN